MPRAIESVRIDGPAGALEAILEEPEDTAPIEAALVCHPHPLYGGTMHNKVVYRLARGLRASGAAVLRFNFRGVNLSEGKFDNGIGETEDARTALAWLRARYPGLPYTLAGFSFGSKVVLKLGCELDGASRMIAAGFPTRAGAFPVLETCPVPKIFLQSKRDQYGPQGEFLRAFETFREPKRIIWIEAADHFFAGALDEFEEAVRGLGN
jgi:alpha/beta superfamily hydrolase